MSDEVKKPQNKIDQETAEFEFERFCESWEIDFDESNFNDEENVDFQKLKKQIVKAITKGRLCVNDDNTLSYIFSKFSEKYADQEITIKRPNGKSYLSMNGYKETQGVSMNFALVGAMLGKPPQYISFIDGIDLKPIQAVAQLFLAE